MPCCGDRRKRLYRPTLKARSSQALRPDASPANRTASASFRYVGRTALTVRGPISGRVYFFEQPGSIMTIDPRDHRALSTVPMLRPTRWR